MSTPALWYHGATDAWQGWREDGPLNCGHWNCLLGIHFASERATAEHFASGGMFHYINQWQPSAGEVVLAHLHMSNPLLLPSERELDALILALAFDSHLITPELLAQWQSSRWFISQWPTVSLASAMEELLAQYSLGQFHLTTALPQELLFELSVFQMPFLHQAASALKDKLRLHAYDGIIYGNILDGRAQVAPFEPTAICFHPSQMEVLSVEPYLPPSLEA